MVRSADSKALSRPRSDQVPIMHAETPHERLVSLKTGKVYVQLLFNFKEKDNE
jgi:hypothetical protein